MIYLTRSASLTGFVPVASALGLDPYALIAEAGLPAGALDDPDLMISAEAFMHLLERAAELSGAPDLGLRIAEARTFSYLGPIWLVAREQPTVRAAFNVLANFLWTHSQGLTVAIETIENIVILRTNIAARSALNTRQTNELVIGMVVRLIRQFLGLHWQPDMVFFGHSAPAKLTRHRAIFGQTPLFLQEFNGIVVKAAEFDQSLEHVDLNAALQLTRFLERTAGSRHINFDDSVRELITLLLPHGTCTVERVARHLGINRRTIHRKLAAHGTTFEALMLEARLELAETYLKEGDKRLRDISDLLGFSSLSAFSRWRRQNGIGTGKQAAPSNGDKPRPDQPTGRFISKL